MASSTAEQEKLMTDTWDDFGDADSEYAESEAAGDLTLSDMNDLIDDLAGAEAEDEDQRLAEKGHRLQMALRNGETANPAYLRPWH